MSLTRLSPSQVERACKFCNVTFFIHQYRLNAGEDKGQFCSVACRRESRKTKFEKPCERCGALFWEVPSVVAIGQGKFCSHECARLSYITLISRTCLVCGASFEITPSHLDRGEGKFCSRECYYTGKIKPLEERFWEKVDKNGPVPEHCPELGNCWLWTGANNGQSPTRKWPYGVIGTGRKGEGHRPAHHVAWEIHHGPIPVGMKVLHRCDMTLCVRDFPDARELPSHLFLGTLKDNTQDMLAKGRHNAPGRPYGSHLSPESLESFRRKRGYVKT